MQLGSDHDAAQVAVGVAADAQHVAVQDETVRIVRHMRAQEQLDTVLGRRQCGVLVQQDPQAAVRGRLEHHLGTGPLAFGQACGGGDVLGG
ncbi:hypothetical protein [Streptomyces sp. NPDC051572]|uniref:hypothetical protein n=1 Tax=Streptomyces sp. NPDC051572 TaxID=3155802 RepID=UPI00344B03EC